MKILNPVGRVDKRAARGLAPRRDLKGGTIGLLSNGKPNAKMLLDLAFDKLQDRLGPLQSVHYEKHKLGSDSGSASPPWLIDKLASGTIAVITGSGLQGRLRAVTMVAGLGAFMVGIVIKPTRRLMERFLLPKPGEGPSPAAQLAGRYDIRFFARTDDGKTLRVKVTGDRDPG